MLLVQKLAVNIVEQDDSKVARFIVAITGREDGSYSVAPKVTRLTVKEVISLMLDEHPKYSHIQREHCV